MKKKLLLTTILFKSRKTKKNKKAKAFFIRQHMEIKQKLNIDIEKTVFNMLFNEDKRKESSLNEDNEMNEENEEDFITELGLFMK